MFTLAFIHNHEGHFFIKDEIKILICLTNVLLLYVNVDECIHNF